MSRSRRFFRPVDGILLLDKPLGLSSNAALQRVRELFAAVKAGHAGSLDPLATGLLPVCFGHATKVCGRLLNCAKTYVVDVQLGASTASGDAETPILDRAPVPQLDAVAIDAALRGFLGAQQQVPPMHSAVKHQGERLYELARRGESVERVARDIVIHGIRRVAFQEDVLTFEVHCSKGTYIRTLAEDVASRLGTLGHLKGLRRTNVDPFGGRAMHSMESLEAQPRDALGVVLLPADAAFADLPAVQLTGPAERNLLLGQPVHASGNIEAGELRAYGSDGGFLGLVVAVDEQRVRPVRLFVDAAASSTDSRTPA